MSVIANLQYLIFEWQFAFSSFQMALELPIYLCDTT